jgi:hypothetical protein
MEVGPLAVVDDLGQPLQRQQLVACRHTVQAAIVILA